MTIGTKAAIVAGLIVVAAVVILGASTVRRAVDTGSQVAVSPIPSASSSLSPQPKGGLTVTYSDAGFDKPELKIANGTAVTFANQRAPRPMWIASNDHPEHLIYPEFDQGVVLGYEPLPKDSSFYFVFTKKGKWKYHDHYDPAQEGQITVY